MLLQGNINAFRV